MQVADARDLQALARVTLIAHGGSREFLVAPHLEALHETVNGGWESTHGKPLNREAVGRRRSAWTPIFQHMEHQCSKSEDQCSTTWHTYACRVLTWMRA